MKFKETANEKLNNIQLKLFMRYIRTSITQENNTPCENMFAVNSVKTINIKDTESL